MTSSADLTAGKTTRSTARRLSAVGFWSYSRQDDQFSSGRLTTLRTLLVQELQQQLGRPLKLFQDVDTIALGTEWERAIRKAIDSSAFFIPIITPSFINSEWCSREVVLFLEREKELRAAHPELADRSLIFPVVFIGIEDAEPEYPEVLAALEKRQWFDFRRFRHRSFEDHEVREALSELAASMRTLLNTRLAAATPASEIVSNTREPAAPAAPAADAPTTVSTPRAAKQPAPEPPEPPAPAAAPAPREIKVGDVLNHMFEVRRVIKQGGMGQVFEGANIHTGERVAIKALLPALASDPKVVQLFHREGLTLGRLSHEALVQYRVLTKEPEIGALYIVTEFVDGVDLGATLGKVPRDEPALRQLLARLASGLASAHRMGAIHRDISPDNVMLPGGDIAKAKIIDFGIAKTIGGNLPTIVGESFAGKLAYVAPEQLGDHDGEIGPWTDVYSLGLVILAAARGEKSDMGGTFSDAIRKRRQPPDLKIVPDGLRPLLEAMLRADPAERMRSMEEVETWLAEEPRRRAAREAEEKAKVAAAEAAAREAGERERREAENRARREAEAAAEAAAARAAQEQAARQAAEQAAQELAAREAAQRAAQEQTAREAAERAAQEEAARESGQQIPPQPIEYDQQGFLQPPPPPLQPTRPAIGQWLGGAAALLVALLLLLWRPWAGTGPVEANQPAAIPAPVSGPGTVPPVTPSTPVSNEVAAVVDRSWLFGRWCMIDRVSGRLTRLAWTFRDRGDRISVTYPGGSQVDRVVSDAADIITTSAAVYRFERAANAVIVQEQGVPDTRLEQCR